MQVPARAPKRRRRRSARYAEQDGVGERRAEATATETDIEASAPQPQGTTTMDFATVPKRNRGIRKPNQYPKKGITFVISRVGEEGQILEPPEYISKFRNVIGAVVRDQLKGT